MLKVYSKDSFGEFKNRIEFDVWQFPGGEQGIKLKDPSLVEKDSLQEDCEFLITWEYEGDSEIFLLALLVDALKGAGARSYQITLSTVNPADLGSMVYQHSVSTLTESAEFVIASNIPFYYCIRLS